VGLEHGRTFSARNAGGEGDPAVIPIACWVVERTFAWLNQFRRLRVRYDKRADIHRAVSLGCALICWHFLRKSWMTA
jgi:hypothetical protein